ncbi:rRNA maturation RNase YbeY [Chloroflexota bacterium]
MLRYAVAMDISVLIESGRAKGLGTRVLRQALETVLGYVDGLENAEMSLILTSQQRVQELNRVYRGKDHPTDVLSFCMNEIASGAAGAGFVPPPDGVHHMGEVIISVPQAQVQAKERGHTLEQEIHMLMVHGVLHLLGYDHNDDEEEAAMQARAAELLGCLGYLF